MTEAAAHEKEAQDLKQKIDGVIADERDRLEDQRKEIGTILISHLSKRPVAALIVTLSETGFVTHCSGFQDIGHALMAREFAQKAATQQFENFMVRNTRLQEAEAQAAAAPSSNPPESVL